MAQENTPQPARARVPKLGQSVRYVLSEGSHNKGAKRFATIVEVKDDGSVGINVMIAGPDDFRVPGGFPSVGIGGFPGKIPLANMLINPAPYDANKAPGTWHYADE